VQIAEIGGKILDQLLVEGGGAAGLSESEGLFAEDLLFDDGIVEGEVVDAIEIELHDLAGFDLVYDAIDGGPVATILLAEDLHGDADEVEAEEMLLVAFGNLALEGDEDAVVGRVGFVALEKMTDGFKGASELGGDGTGDVAEDAVATLDLGTGLDDGLGLLGVVHETETPGGTDVLAELLLELLHGGMLEAETALAVGEDHGVTDEAFFAPAVESLGGDAVVDHEVDDAVDGFADGTDVHVDGAAEVGEHVKEVGVKLYAGKTEGLGVGGAEVGDLVTDVFVGI